MLSGLPYIIQIQNKMSPNQLQPGVKLRHTNRES